MAAKTVAAKIPTVVPTDAELEELGKSLTAKEIPAKLRCGICDLTAYNAIRLPCCSTNICENCFKTELPDDSDECILCHHTPLDKSICTANKSMRTTIRALLKNKFETRLKRQNAEAAKAAKEAEIVRPAEPEASTNGKASNDAGNNHELGGDHANDKAGKFEAVPMEVSASTALHEHAGLNGDAQSSEFASEVATGVGTSDSRKEGQEERPATAESEGTGVATSQQNGQWATGNSRDQLSMNGSSGINSMNSMNGMYPMDFSSMMSTGMMPMAGLPNMMGMGMMPSMMSQMFGGFDGSNMGMNMNAMNAGVGFNNQNQYGGSWMGGQDAYNNNAYGSGGYGNQGGYNNSGNYNNVNDQAYANNDFHRGYGRQGFQNRRGRRGYYNGGYGRNNYNQTHQGNQYGYPNQNGSTQQTYQQHQSEKFSNTNGGNSTVDQVTQDGVMSEEAEAQMMKDLAPGGQHDFDEELGRRPSLDETVKNSSENAENAETSISSDFKGRIPIDATPEEATEANERVNMAVADGEHSSNKKADPDDQSFQAVEPTAATADAATNESKDTVESNGIEGDDGTSDPTPQPIQTFISDEPRSRNAMPPPVTSTSVGPVSQVARGFGRSNGQTTSIASPAIETPSIEPNGVGVGVVGAPTGPRALRQGLRNTGRSGWNPSNASNPPASESTRSDGRGRSRSRSSHRHPSMSKSRSRSRSPVHRYSDHRSRRHHSPSESNEPRYSRYEEVREDRREDKREERRHRHSHRSYEEDEVNGTDDRYSSHRSHRRYDKDVEQSDRRRHHHHRSRSQSSDHDGHRERDRERHKDRDRIPEREKHHYREDDRDEERKHRRKESRSLGNSAAPTPTTPFAPELANGYEDHSSRKRRDRDYDEDREQDRYERKRSRREPSPSYEKKSDRHANSYESSKPSTPITPSFSGPSPISRRGSVTTNGVNQVKAPIISKPIPTGPRAALQQSRKGERVQEPERQAPTAPAAKKPEKDVHTLEREARDRERLQREMQRRAFGSSKRRTSGTATQPGRRVSYKYEDEDGLDARRVEHEREAGRWS